ncbi:MAG TPA: flagellar basal body rod C-terminal domain-containing protein [Deferrisomatales bacterium]|nr:flagellar basal body rod C-terminal domain-containing protein [Deferrisomatales bacterium]
MISGINAALSGVLAHQRRVDTAGNNLANLSTDGFKRSRVVMEDQPGGVRTESQRVETPGPLRSDLAGAPVEGSNVDIAEEMAALLTGERGFEANLKTIQTQDEMLGELLDIVG